MASRAFGRMALPGVVSGVYIPPIAPTLGTLTLSGTLTNGTSSSGTINGATNGSTITSNVTGLTVNSGARTYTFDGTAAAATIANGLVETLAGATGSPKGNPITVASAVLAISGTPGAATQNSPYSFTPTVTGGSGTKTFTSTGTPLPTGLSLSSSTGAITGTPTVAATTNGIAITVTDSSGSATLSGLSIVVSAAGSVAGATATSFATTPTTHYHIPAGSTVATQTITAVPANVLAATSVTDIRGLANATNGANTGPIVMTDALGRKFLRFTNATGTGTNGDGPNGPNLLQIAAALTGTDHRQLSCFMVGRVHKAVAQTFLSLGVAGSSPPNTGGGLLRQVIINTGSVVMSGMGNRPATGAGANVNALYPGAQMQVLGASSRTVSGTGTDQGQRLSINNRAGNVDRTGATVLSYTGATIGSYALAPDVGYFDLYEMAIFQGQLTDAQHDAIAAAMVSNWQIPAVTDQLVLEGDSITAGIRDSTAVAGTGIISGINLAMQLTEPGTPLIPATCRVINQGISGDNVANLVTRRDAVGSVYDTGKLPGRNIVAVHIGRNDWVNTTQSGTDTYNAIVALISTATTGYLARGFEVAQAINIANGGLVAAWTQQNTLLRAAQFFTDTGSGPGQTYDGKVTRVDLNAITSGGQTRFATAANATDTAYYQGTGGGTHPNRVGQALIATGGDTPQNGYGAIL